MSIAPSRPFIDLRREAVGKRHPRSWRDKAPPPSRMVPVSLVLRRSSCALEFPYILVRHRPDATPAVSGLQLSPLSNRHQHLLLQHDSVAPVEADWNVVLPMSMRSPR